MDLEYAGRRYPVTEGDLTLGSDPSCGIVLPGASPAHAVVRALGDKMATVRVAEPGLEVTVNTVRVGREATPILHGDVIRIGEHEILVSNPAHPVGTPVTPPEGAKERLHDTLFGVPRTNLSIPRPEPAPEAPAGGSGRLWIVVAAVVSVAIIAFLLLR